MLLDWLPKSVLFFVESVRDELEFDTNVDSFPSFFLQILSNDFMKAGGSELKELRVITSFLAELPVVEQVRCLPSSLRDATIPSSSRDATFR